MEALTERFRNSRVAFSAVFWRNALSFRAGLLCLCLCLGFYQLLRCSTMLAFCFSVIVAQRRRVAWLFAFNHSICLHKSLSLPLARALLRYTNLIVYTLSSGLLTASVYVHVLSLCLSTSLLWRLLQRAKKRFSGMSVLAFYCVCTSLINHQIFPFYVHRSLQPVSRSPLLLRCLRRLRALTTTAHVTRTARIHCERVLLHPRFFTRLYDAVTSASCKPRTRTNGLHA